LLERGVTCALDLRHNPHNSRHMKSTAILFCLIFALSKAAAQDAVAPTNHIEFFKVITDAQSGRYAVLDSDKTVILRDKNGNMIWSTNIASVLKTYPVYSMELNRDNILIHPSTREWDGKWVGMVTILVDKKTGKVGVQVE
jgi:hypothetical protein